MSTDQGALNPYDSFRSLKPTAIIQHGLFVYDAGPGGHFAIPLASALDQAQKAQTALAAKDLNAALHDAQQAVALAPESVFTQSALADVLAAQGNAAEARVHYAAALQSARTIEPSLQAGLVPGLEAKLKP